MQFFVIVVTIPIPYGISHVSIIAPIRYLSVHYQLPPIYIEMEQRFSGVILNIPTSVQSYATVTQKLPFRLFVDLAPFSNFLSNNLKKSQKSWKFRF